MVWVLLLINLKKKVKSDKQYLNTLLTPDDFLIVLTLFDDIFQVGRDGILSFEKGTTWPWFDSSRKVVCVYCTYISNEQSKYIARLVIRFY